MFAHALYVVLFAAAAAVAAVSVLHIADRARVAIYGLSAAAVLVGAGEAIRMLLALTANGAVLTGLVSAAPNVDSVTYIAPRLAVAAQFRPPINMSLLPAVSLAASGGPMPATGLPHPLPDQWSPFTWAQNAAIVAGQPSPANDRTKLVAQELLAILAKHTQQDGDSRFVVYDFPFRYFNYTLTPPWRSALGNADAAIGLMHLSTALNEPSLMAMAKSYLLPLKDRLTSRGSDGSFWLEEYVSPDLPGGGDGVINGHFGALAALQEWRLRTGDHEFDDTIEKAIDTYAEWLPKITGGGHFGYSRGHPTWKDYGQERAVIQADAACRMTGRADLCASAAQFLTLYEQWNPGKPAPIRP